MAWAVVLRKTAKAKKAGGEGVTEKEEVTAVTVTPTGPTWKELSESTGTLKQTLMKWWKAFTAEMGYPKRYPKVFGGTKHGDATTVSAN